MIDFKAEFNFTVDSYICNRRKLSLNSFKTLLYVKTLLLQKSCMISIEIAYLSDSNFLTCTINILNKIYRHSGVYNCYVKISYQ